MRPAQSLTEEFAFFQITQTNVVLSDGLLLVPLKALQRALVRAGLDSFTHKSRQSQPNRILLGVGLCHL